MQSIPSSTAPAVDPPGIFSVGTLRYTKPALFVTMAWLLWGDFCFMLMESVVPTLLPLKLRHLDAPNWLIALILTTIPSLLNATVCPAVSFLSDRHRSPRGRRIPFILYTIPFLCACLMLMGLAPWLAGLLKRSGIVDDETLAALVLLGLFATGFQFFNMFVSSVYYYLFNDVVPVRFIGRFMSLFRLVGVLAASLYSFLIFPHAETHFAGIFIAASLLYGVVFYLMCLKVKEGAYPPAPELPAREKGALLTGIRVFFRECYTSRVYWYFYLFVAMNATAITINVFQVFFAQSLGITLKQFGWYMGAYSMAQAALLMPCGWITDRLGPLRTVRIAITALAMGAPLWLIVGFMPIPEESRFIVWCCTGAVIAPLQALFLAAELPSYMRILPKDRYGQFSSATALFRSLVVLVGGLLGGVMIDVLKRSVGVEMAYRYLPFWLMTFYGLSAASLWLLRAELKKHLINNGEAEINTTAPLSQ